MGGKKKGAAAELLKPKRPNLRELIRGWVREKGTFSLGEAQLAYNGLGGQDHKRDGYNVYHRFSDIVTHKGSGPQGGRYSFTITCTYIGEEAERKQEAEREAVRARDRLNSPGALWDKLPR